MVCPECGTEMKKWYLLGGRVRWECPKCNYTEVE